MNNVYFLSDCHFSHISQLYFHPKRRELAGISLNELQNLDKQTLIKRYDDWLIDLWNSTVNRGDSVYHLGDFCLGNRERAEYLLNRLHGKKFFIRGNHDKALNGNERFLEGLWDIKEAKFTKEQFPFIDPNETFCVEMCHYPLIAWNRKMHGTVHACGHVHGNHDRMNADSGELRVDVGFDGKLADYNLISLEKLYGHFDSIVKNNGCKSFQEYAEFLALKRGYRD